MASQRFGELVVYFLFLNWITSGAIYLLLRSRWRSGERKFLLAVTAVGFAFCVYEAYMSFVWSPKVVAPIRIDLLLIVPALSVAYGGAALVAIRNVVRDRPGAGLRVPVLVLSALLMAVPTWNLGRLLQIFREGRELTSRFMSREKLLFEARFRDPETFARRFGPVSTVGPNRDLSGHWVPARPLIGITRMIINDEGRIWTFRECGRTGDMECLRGEGQVRIFDFAMNGSEKVELKAEVTLPALQLTRASEGKIKVRVVNPQAKPDAPVHEEVFERKDIPFQSKEAAKAVTALPPLAATIPNPPNGSLEIIELRRWKEGGELLAVLFTRSVARDAKTADFLQPLVFRGKAGSPTTLTQIGDGVPAAGPAMIELTETGSGARAVIRPLRPAEPVELKPGVLVDDEVLELAPRTSLADVEEWLRIQGTGKFFSAKLPD